MLENRAKNFVKAALNRITDAHTKNAAGAYIAGGQIPWSPGYSAFKTQCILEIFDNKRLMGAFRDGSSLPEDFGYRLDERIVEYPWVMAHLADDATRILDAGSTLNAGFLLHHPWLKKREIIIYTLEADHIELTDKVSYIFGDLRDVLLKDNVIHSIICISTLEHVGFTYEYKTYSRHNPWPYAKPESFKNALAEFRRVLRPGGQLLLTVPFGKYENHGWLQQFDTNGVNAIKGTFGGELVDERYFRYVDDAWRVATPGECSDLGYFNIHESGEFDPDHVAAARAVACLYFRNSV